MNHEYIIISYLLENPKKVPVAIEKIKPLYFASKQLRAFYKLICKSRVNKYNVNYNILEQILRRKKLKRSMYDTYETLLNFQNRTNDEFLFSIKEITEQYRKRLLVRGVTKISQQIMADATNDAQETLEALNSHIANSKLGYEGRLVDIRSDIDKSKKDYVLARKEARDEENGNRIFTGFNFIDNITGGGKPGELWIWGGYTGDGKTQFAKEVAYNAIVEQKKNVVFVSLEMSVEEMKILLESRHVHKLYPGGVLTKEIEMGTLKRKNRKRYFKALEDWKSGGYGKFKIWSPGYGCTVEDIKNKLELISLEMRIDFVIIDYIQLLELNEKVYETRNQVTRKVEKIKDLARTFNNNKGVFILSPHQMSSAGKEAAEKRGHYVLKDFAESAGVPRTANLCGWTLITEDLKNENKIRIGISKYRSGSIDQRGVDLMQDFAHSMMAEIQDYNEYEEKI